MGVCFLPRLVQAPELSKLLPCLSVGSELVPGAGQEWERVGRLG